MKILTLSGWAQPGDALARSLSLHHAGIFDYSDYPDVSTSFEGLRAFADVESVVAWSMGGQLALRAIAAGILRPRHLTLIAAPYQFVRNADFSEAMDPVTYRRFRDNYASDPARTKNRFHALVAKGDAEMKRVLPLLDHHPEVENTARWLPWLEELAAYSLHAADLAAIPPTLLVHGTEDAIVPLAQSEVLAQRLPDATLVRWEGVAHAPHLRDAMRLLHDIAVHRTQTA